MRDTKVCLVFFALICGGPVHSDTHLVAPSIELSVCSGVFLGLQAAGLTSQENSSNHVNAFMKWLGEKGGTLSTKHVIDAYEATKTLDTQDMSTFYRDAIAKCHNYFLNINSD
jgi:hypothetical protein